MRKTIITPTPAGPKIIETTIPGIQLRFIPKIKLAASNATTPKILLTIIFFKKKKINIVTIIKMIAGKTYSAGSGTISVAFS